jgi:hypothetical protein
LYEQKCRVELVQDFLQCGILVLEGKDNRRAYCFFFKKDYNARQEGSQNDKMTSVLPKGKELFANARLVAEGSNVPYMATTVWEEGANMDSNIMAKIFEPSNATDLEKFKELSIDLAWCLPKLTN